MTALDAARDWCARGYYPIPIPPREKGPRIQNWQQLRITAETAALYFDDAPQNIGVLLGDDHGAADIDLDCAESIIAATVLLPDTGLKFGRKSKPASHYFFRVDPPIASVKFTDPIERDKDRATLIEFRCLKKDGSPGFQTVVPFSIHPSGEGIKFESGFDRAPSNIDTDVLIRAVSRVAAASLLARHWPGAGSGRNDAFLALAGILARADWKLDEAVDFHFAMYRVLWNTSANREACAAEVQATFDKYATGHEITGIPKLLTLIDRRVVEVALEWLGINCNSAPASASVPDSALRAFPFTDSGNAERIARKFAGSIRYCAPQRSWYIWTGKRWEPDQTGEMLQRTKIIARELYEEAGRIEDADKRRACAEWARKCESAERRKAALFLAGSEPGIPILPAEFDAEPFALNCINGVVNLRTGELREHRPDDLITRLAPVEYDGAARSELWERFLDESTAGDKELRDFLQRAAGYSLTGSVREEVLFFVHGPAASGKSTFLETLKASFGDYAKVADFESFIARRDAGAIRNDIAELAGRRFVLSIEVDEGKKLAEGLVKLLTGGDTVRARFLYQEAFEFAPSFKLWLAANHAPRVRDTDSAMWRRILRLPFEHIVPKDRRDPRLKADLKDPTVSGPAILAWAIEGCLRWQEDGLCVPAVVERATEQYRLDMDPLRLFFDEKCDFAADARCSVASLRAAYETWAKESGERYVLDGRQFTERLTERGCSKVRQHGGVRAWQGITLREG